MYKPYTGVGSRKAPQDVLELMTAVATELSHRDFTLRSGGAIGSDTAFERGIAPDKDKEIYLAYQATAEAMAIAERFHPAWHKCPPYAKKLHGRNAFQVLGLSLNNPSKFLICWTPDGCIEHRTRRYETGGTGTAISIADYYSVPVFNLYREDHRGRLETMLKETVTA